MVTNERMISASYDAKQGDLGTMQRMMSEIANPESVRLMDKAISHLEEAKAAGRVNLDVQKLYMAATVEGREYNGSLAVKSGDFFIMKEGSSVLVGQSKDLPVGNSANVSFKATEMKAPSTERSLKMDY